MTPPDVHRVDEISVRDFVRSNRTRWTCLADRVYEMYRPDFEAYGYVLDSWLFDF